MPRYIFFTFDEVIAQTKTAQDSNANPVIFSSSIEKKIKNPDWLARFIKKRNEVGDFIFIVSENSNIMLPINYLKAMFGAAYKNYIKRIEICKGSQSPTYIIKAIEDILAIEKLGSLASLSNNIIVVGSSSDSINAIKMRGCEGVLVEKDSNIYMSALERLVNTQPGETDDARMRALVDDGVKRLSLRRATLPPAPKGKTRKKTEHSFLLFGSRSSSNKYSGVNKTFSTSTNDEFNDDDENDNEKCCCRCFC